MPYEYKEDWTEIEGFPGYVVGRSGRVANASLNGEIAQSINQQGVVYVRMIHEDRKQKSRSIAPLVAAAFLPPPENENWDTPINLDYDRTNNHVNNLAWRPRWYAIRYHLQHKEDLYGNSDLYVRDLSDDEVLHVKDAAKKHGLLEIRVVAGALSDTPVFPTGHRFEMTRPN